MDNNNNIFFIYILNMEKPIVNEVFCDNGEHSHWNLIDPETGKNLWSEDFKEDELNGFPVVKQNNILNNELNSKSK
jgi:hypothetical protein